MIIPDDIGAAAEAAARARFAKRIDDLRASGHEFGWAEPQTWEAMTGLDRRDWVRYERAQMEAAP